MYLYPTWRLFDDLHVGADLGAGEVGPVLGQPPRRQPRHEPVQCSTVQFNTVQYNAVQ